MTPFDFGLVVIRVPDGWSDSSQINNGEVTVSTVVGPDRVGVLQISAALYDSGFIPDYTTEVLSGMLADFAWLKGFPARSEVVVEAGPQRLAAREYTWGTDIVRVWYVSDGSSVAMATYVAPGNGSAREMAECEQIVRSIKFRTDRQPDQLLSPFDE